MADLSVKVAGVRFKNPLFIASSDVTEGFERMKRGIDAGAGAVIAKSYCGAYTSGNEQRRQAPLAKFLFLGYDRRPAYGKSIPKLFTNLGRSGMIQWSPTAEDDWIEMLLQTQKYAAKFDANVIGSIFGSKVLTDMTRVAKKMEQAGLKMLEVDLGCPNVEKMQEKGALLKSSQDYFDVAKAICESVSIPVFIKLSPQQADLAATAQGVKGVGAAGVTCHNRFLGFMVDIDTAKPLIWGWSGSGGPFMLPISLGWVSRIREKLPDFPILGSSGVYDWEDVVRFHMAGANAVEMCVTVMVHGYRIITETRDALNKFLDDKGYKGVQDIVGIALKSAHNYTQMYSIPEYHEKSTIDQNLCIHCGNCYNICWYGAIERKAGTGIAPCTEACPAGIDAARYVQLTAQGKYDEALAVVREKIPFPFVCGTACLHPCETKCARGRLDEPISIMAIKRFVAERDSGYWKSKSKVAKKTGKRVAIVGSGPAGLTAGYYLAKSGHGVTVFEASPVAGGVMRTAIPDYRLPKNLLDEEINGIKEVGVKIKTRTKINSADELLSQGYDAVLVATGAHGELPLGIDGENTPGVLQGLPLLEDVKLGKKVKIGDKVVVVGGGNTAIDASRTAVRLGAKDVTILYRRSRAEMPASKEEIEQALQEGIEIQFLAAPSRISKNNGWLNMQCIRMKLGKVDASGRPRPEPIVGSEFNIDADTILTGIGETPDGGSQFGLKRVGGNRIWADPKTLVTSQKGVFASGDAVSGPASIIEAIAMGRKAAISIDKYLGGKGVIDETLALPKDKAKPLDADRLPEERRPEMPTVSILKRITSFNQVERGYTEEEAVNEAKRCLRCDANWIYNVNEDYCIGCYTCKAVCPVPGCINMKQSPPDKWPPLPPRYTQVAT